MINSMNIEAKVELERILGKAQTELTEDEKRFLRARRDYLNKAQKEDYKDIIEAKPPKTETVKENAKK